MPVSADSATHEIYQHLLSTIRSERFLKMQGLNNEVPFYICAFKPQKQNEMNAMVGQLVNQLRVQGVRVLHIDLYDLSNELIQTRRKWDAVINKEPQITKAQLQELLQGMLDPEKHVVPAIAEKIKQDEFEVMFLTGVGEVFPYIRAHTLLNNLQTTAQGKPLVMFFPGEYIQSNERGSTLSLFGIMQDKYYRAFDINKHF